MPTSGHRGLVRYRRAPADFLLALPARLIPARAGARSQARSLRFD